MIFVTVASHHEGYDRLVRKMDEIAGRIDEKVVIQNGHTKYKPTNAEYFDFGDYTKIQEYHRHARVIVSHAGVGSILTAFDEKKPIIIVPRLKALNEHIDDHQSEIAEVMSKNKNVRVVYDIEKLEGCLKEDIRFIDGNDGDNRLVVSIKKYLDDLST